jgi:hypothetical protein
VTYKYVGFQVGHWVYLTLVAYNTYDYNSRCGAVPIHTITVYSIQLYRYYTQSTVHYNTHRVLLVCCPTLVLGYRLLTADIPFLVSRTVPIAQPQQLLTQSSLAGTAFSCPDLYCLEFFQ